MRASSFACVLSVVVPLCFSNFSAASTSTTIRIPKRVRVEIDRFQDAADGTARVGPPEYAVLEYHETPVDEYRAAECSVVDLEATVAFCDCRAACSRSEPPARGADTLRVARGTSARVNFDLFLYKRDDATYFSAAVTGDVVATHETGSAIVTGARFNRLVGPHRWSPEEPAANKTGADVETDAIGGRALGEWLHREFSDRDFGGAGEGDDAAPVLEGGCADVRPPNRGGAGFRRVLTAVGCLRAFSGKRCAGDSTTLLSTPESSPAEEPDVPFPVKSVSDCGCRRLNRPSGFADGRSRREPNDAPALQCTCDCGSPANSDTSTAAGSAEETSPIADGSPGTGAGPPVAAETAKPVPGAAAAAASVSTQTDPEDPAPPSAIASADFSASAATASGHSPSNDSTKTASIGTDAGPATSAEQPERSPDVSARPAAVVSAVTTESLPGNTADASTRTDPEFFASPVTEFPSRGTAESEPAKTSAKPASDDRDNVPTGSTAEPPPDDSTAGPQLLRQKTEPLRGTTVPSTETVPGRSSGDTTATSAADDRRYRSAAEDRSTGRPITFSEVTTRMAEDAWNFVTALAMAVGSFLWSAYRTVGHWSP